MSDTEKETRDVFDKLHRQQGDDEAIFNRLVKLVHPAIFGMPDDFFHGKVVLDAGTGTNANAAYAMLAHGAGHVFALDIGDAWQSYARQKLTRFDESRFTLVEGDVQNLDFPDGKFDFVHCNGVLHHLPDAKRAVTELARVTKSQGHLFIGMLCAGNGMIYQWIDILRTRYQNDAAFKTAVDTWSADQLDEAVDWILNVRMEQEGSSEAEAQFFKSLFNKDLILTIQDRLQAPIYDYHHTEAEISGWLESAGIKSYHRIKKYPAGIQNVRRFFAPMFYHYNHPIARLFFGDGFVQVFAQKG